MRTTLVANTLAKLTGLFSKPPYRVGAALSGGGVRGFAHVGVLEALDNAHIVPDIVAGVSAGAVAAVFYASGLPYSEMMKAFEGMRFNDVGVLGMPNNGFFKLDKFAQFLERSLPYKRIEDLPIKTVICAVDLDRGEAVAFEEGPIADCVIASCSIPVVFKPKVINGVRYVDGGVLHNLPAWAIRERCRTLYGVNVSPIVKQTKRSSSLVEIATRSFKLMAKVNAIPDMALCDHVITVDSISHYNVFDLKEIEKIYRSGYKTAQTFLSQQE